MGKKPKQHTEATADREKAIEALYFARKCGLTKEEALKMSGKPKSGSMMDPKGAPASELRSVRRALVSASGGA
ncbi:hypothetical protein [Mesorhizobium sp. M0011]|uniref:hypothetical protein n=1 Tax=Mesorhizobium sp. M0011 TaxID=2956839 RepID=UPI003339B4F8